MNALGLNAGGWIFIAAAWSLIIGVTVFCFKRVLGAPKQQ